jgi:hypothetical protein
MSTSKALLIVYHSMTDGTRQMAEVEWVRVEISSIMAGVADLKVPRCWPRLVSGRTGKRRTTPARYRVG